MTSPVRVRYQTIEFGSMDIHLCTLRDKQQFSDPEGIAEALGISEAQWSMFGVIWPSSLVLANYVVDYNTQGKRILEVGCGMALTSLLLSKQLRNITATDYHPEVAAFLERNSRLNHGTAIRFKQCDWNDFEKELGLFDLIIGSDLLYEDHHIKQLSAFINCHAKPNCEVILVDPGRGRKNKLTLQMDLFGFDCKHLKPQHTDYLEDPFKGHILKFWRNDQS